MERVSKRLKFAIGDTVQVNANGVLKLQGKIGKVVKISPASSNWSGKTEYVVNFTGIGAATFYSNQLDAYSNEPLKFDDSYFSSKATKSSAHNPAELFPDEVKNELGLNDKCNTEKLKGNTSEYNDDDWSNFCNKTSKVWNKFASEINKAE